MGELYQKALMNTCAQSCPPRMKDRGVQRPTVSEMTTLRPKDRKVCAIGGLAHSSLRQLAPPHLKPAALRERRASAWPCSWATMSRGAIDCGGGGDRKPRQQTLIHLS
jgi:hypothetical protein